MTDETKSEETTPETEATTDQATATAEEGHEHEHDHDHDHGHDHDHDHDHDHGEGQKLKQTVDITDVGPCKKHIKITVDREMIDQRVGEKFREMGRDASIPGFRKGKAPLRVIQKRYKRDVIDQVKSEVLMASLEQLAEEQDIAPLGAPEIDPEQLDIPDEGDFIYEFEVEVRPEFDLPEYKGITLKRPVYTFTDEDVDQEIRRILNPMGQIVPKENGETEIGDILVADVIFKDGDKELGSSEEVQFRVEKQVAFTDSIAQKFGEEVAGAKAGDKRTVTLTLSSQVGNADLRGKEIQMALDVKDVKTIRLPDLTEEFLEENIGVSNVEQFKERIQALLQLRLAYQQRQSAREQILKHIAAAADWEIPEDLLVRQARRAMGRRIMEMRADGISDEEIDARRRVLEQDILQSTEMALKEHFVLQKIAEEEKIDVSDDDIADEIDRIADQSGESPRRVRARLEKDDMLDSLAAEMIERKALDLIFEHAKWEEEEIGEKPIPSVSTVEEQAVPGEMRDLEAEQASEEAAEKEEETETSSQ